VLIDLSAGSRIMFTPDIAKPIPLLPEGWDDLLDNELMMRRLTELLEAVGQERERGDVFPEAADIFRAFSLVPPTATRVVIIGQDPYHGPGQAHGLAFSVPAGQRHPPSLRNIFKEILRDLGHAPPSSGDLAPWARQGVLLMNSCLTVRKSEAGSHQKMGWERFTDAVISHLSIHGRPGIVFLLWGTHAQKKAGAIDRERHHILVAPHPSPLSAHRGFIGCGHFSKVNELLKAQGDPPIDWALP
jgi:uracil-DNA glycosylase